jgi:hypothetical protein
MGYSRFIRLAHILASNFGANPIAQIRAASSRRLRSWRRVQRQPRQRRVRIRLRASVVAGREWLVHGFLSDLLKEQADESLIMHGPVVLTVDEQAARSFRAHEPRDALERAAGASRGRDR